MPFDLANARRDWSAVFAAKDPFGCPFQPHVPAVLVVSPTYGLHLTPEQYDALRVALGPRTEHVHIAQVEYAGDFLARGGMLSGRLPEYVTYDRLPLTIENALFGPDWGLIVSHESHGVLGGPSDVIERFKAQYPRWRADLDELLSTWQDHPNGAWVADLARAVLGAR